MSNELTKATTPKPDTFTLVLAGTQKGLESLLPDALVRRELRLLAVEATINPKIRMCTPLSIQRSIFIVGQLGLEFGATRGEVYAIPRKSGDVMELNLQIGYKGYLTLARRAGVREVRTGLVWNWEQYRYQEGLSCILEHTPLPPPKDAVNPYSSDNLVAAYAIAVVDGRPVHRWMWGAEILQRRARSDGYRSFASGQARSTPWSTDFGSMARKTVIRALLTGGTVPMHDPTGMGLAIVMEDDASAAERSAVLATMAAENERAASVIGSYDVEDEDQDDLTKMEEHLGPEKVTEIRAKLHIPAGTVPPGMVPAYMKALQAAIS